ncbi:phosphopantetheine adenylyltransferase [Hyphobacterium sp.]|uniref:phosphopantetheine adenylyltransferase n=1 Tax=Hyphobacterium sp. TaxID=2004662 RepID=UPI003BAA3053
MEIAIAALIALAGLINFLPVFGALSRKRIERVYQIQVEGPDLSILMRHRAVLFGLVGGFMIYAAFDRNLWLIACVLGVLSMASFILLAWSTGGYNAALRKVVIADIIGIVLVIAALGLMAV